MRQRGDLKWKLLSALIVVAAVALVVNGVYGLARQRATLREIFDQLPLPDGTILTSDKIIAGGGRYTPSFHALYEYQLFDGRQGTPENIQNFSSSLVRMLQDAGYQAVDPETSQVGDHCWEGQVYFSVTAAVVVAPPDHPKARLYMDWASWDTLSITAYTSSGPFTSPPFDYRC